MRVVVREHHGADGESLGHGPVLRVRIEDFGLQSSPVIWMGPESSAHIFCTSSLLSALNSKGATDWKLKKRVARTARLLQLTVHD